MPQHPALRPRSAFPSGQIHESVYRHRGRRRPAHPDHRGGAVRHQPRHVFQSAGPGHRAGRHLRRALHRLPAVRGGARVQAGAHRVPQRPARPAARHRRAGEHGPAVDEHRRAQGRTGAEEGLEPLPAHRRAAHHRQHPGRPDHRAVAMARGAAARARTGRGADVPRHGHLRPGLRHAGHAGGPDQPDGHPGRRQHADHRPAAGDRPDDHVLRHPAGQPGVQAHRGQAGAPHRPPRRIHEHGAARHRHDVREARPGRRARDPQFLRHARRGRDL